MYSGGRRGIPREEDKGGGGGGDSDDDVDEDNNMDGTDDTGVGNLLLSGEI